MSGKHYLYSRGARAKLLIEVGGILVFTGSLRFDLVFIRKFCSEIFVDKRKPTLGDKRKSNEARS